MQGKWCNFAVTIRFLCKGNGYKKRILKNMERKFINRFYSYCNCLKDFSEAKYRDITDSFVLSGTVNKFSLTFDLSWKVMKDILVQYYAISDFAAASPRETLVCLSGRFDFR